MPEVLRWQDGAEGTDLPGRAAAALAEGRLVALPTETAYVRAASAQSAEAVARLGAANGVAPPEWLTLLLPDAAQAENWVPGLSKLGRRLCRRCWPGPVTLVFEGPGEAAGQLPAPVLQQLCRDGLLPLHVPEHPVLRRILAQLSVPVVVRAAVQPAGPVTSVEQLLAGGADVELVIDAGASPGPVNSVVQIGRSNWKVLHEGAVVHEELALQTRCLVVFVCTGNTCRSPLAEVLCKQRLAERLGCDPTDLPARGFLVHSAGLAAMLGERAPPAAQAVAQELGVDLSGHVSRPLFPDIAEQADFLIAMTHGHVAILLRRYPALGCPPRLLSPAGHDIPDPIGGSAEVYRDCAREILLHLDALVPELVQS
jgi:protein-tyrosine phosphatase